MIIRLVSSMTLRVLSKICVADIVSSRFAMIPIRWLLLLRASDGCGLSDGAVAADVAQSHPHGTKPV